MGCPGAGFSGVVLPGAGSGPVDRPVSLAGLRMLRAALGPSGERGVASENVGFSEGGGPYLVVVTVLDLRACSWPGPIASSGALVVESSRCAARPLPRNTLGVDLDGLIEAAQARSERLFWTVTNPNQHPGPSTLAGIAGAWFHGAMCAAMSRTWRSPLPSRLVGTAELMVAVKAFEAECEVTGHSKGCASATRDGPGPTPTGVLRSSPNAWCTSCRFPTVLAST